MSYLQRIIDALDETSDEETIKIAKNLTEDEAKILTIKLDHAFNYQTNILGATPFLTIIELRRIDDVLNYNLSFKFNQWGNFKFS